MKFYTSQKVRWPGRNEKVEQHTEQIVFRKHTREQPRLNLPTDDHENRWETVETIDLWVADRKSVG
jgi:hypothetical protein